MISRLSRNVVYNVAGQAALTVLSLLAIHIVYRQLGASTFGVLTVSLVWNATLVSALELGFSSIVVQAVAASRSEGGDVPEGLLKSASTIYWGLALAGAVLVYLTLPSLFPLLFRGVGGGTRAALSASRVLLIGGLLAVPRVLYQAVLRGVERMGGYNLVTVVSQAAEQLGIYLLAAAGAGIVDIAWWVMAWFALSTGATLVLALRAVPRSSLILGWDGAAVRRYRSFAGSMATVSATAVVQTQGDKTAVSWTLPVAVAGYYATGSALLGRVQSLVTAAAEASLPSIARSHVDEQQSVAIRYQKLHDLICFGSLPCYAVVAYAVGPVFVHLFSRHASSMVEVPVALLGLGFFANATVSALYITALGTGQAGTVAKVNVVSTVLVFPVVVTLTHFVGLVGASLGWLMYGTMTYVLLVPKLVGACLGTNAAAWFKTNARNLPPLAVFVAGWLLLQVFGPDRISVVVACLVPALVLHVVLSAALVGPELRTTVSTAWAGLTGRRAAP